MTTLHISGSLVNSSVEPRVADQVYIYYPMFNQGICLYECDDHTNERIIQSMNGQKTLRRNINTNRALSAYMMIGHVYQRYRPKSR